MGLEQAIDTFKSLRTAGFPCRLSSDDVGLALSVQTRELDAKRLSELMTIAEGRGFTVHMTVAGLALRE